MCQLPLLSEVRRVIICLGTYVSKRVFVDVCDVHDAPMPVFSRMASIGPNNVLTDDVSASSPSFPSCTIVHVSIQESGSKDLVPRRVQSMPPRRFS